MMSQMPQQAALPKCPSCAEPVEPMPVQDGCHGQFVLKSDIELIASPETGG